MDVRVHFGNAQRVDERIEQRFGEQKGELGARQCKQQAIEAGTGEHATVSACQREQNGGGRPTEQKTGADQQRRPQCATLSSSTFGGAQRLWQWRRLLAGRHTGGE